MKKKTEISTDNYQWHTLEDGKPSPMYPIEAEVEIDASKVRGEWYRGRKGHQIDVFRSESNSYLSVASFKDYSGRERKLRISARRIIRWRYKPDYLQSVLDCSS